VSEEQTAGIALRPPTSTRRSKLIAGGTIVVGAVLAIAAIGAIILRPTAPAVYRAGSPEAAFQSYLIEYDAGDLDAAYTRFSASVRSQHSFPDYRQVVSNFAWQDADDRRVVLDGVDRTGDTAVLHIRVERFTADGLGGNRTSYEQAIRLVHEVGAWKIDELLAGVESAAYYDY
jgi:hypothetical protein